MELLLKEGNMTISMDFEETASPEEVLLGACDILSRVFTQKNVVEAYRSVDPNSMTIKKPQSNLDIGSFSTK